MIHQGKTEIEWSFFEKWLKSTLVFSTSVVILKGTTMCYWAILILFHALAPALRRAIFATEERAEEIRWALNHHYFVLQHSDTGWDHVLSSKTQLGFRLFCLKLWFLAVLLSTQPLLVRGCKSGSQYSPRFILSLIASPSQNSVFDGSLHLGAVSRLRKYYTLYSGYRLLLAHRDCFCDRQVASLLVE